MATKHSALLGSGGSTSSTSPPGSPAAGVDSSSRRKAPPVPVAPLSSSTVDADAECTTEISLSVDSEHDNTQTQNKHSRESPSSLLNSNVADDSTSSSSIFTDSKKQSIAMICLRVLGFVFTPNIFVTVVLIISLSIGLFSVLASLTTNEETFVCPIGVNLSAVFVGIAIYFIFSSGLLALLYHRIETTYVYWKGIGAFFLVISWTSAAILSNAAFDECIFESFVYTLVKAIKGWVVTLCIFYWIFLFLMATLYIIPIVQRLYNTPKPGVERRKETSKLMIDFVSRYDLGVNVPGAIGLSIAPGRNKRKWERNLVEDLRTVREDYQVDVVVTLLTDGDLAWLQSTSIGEKVEAMGMTWIHFPIRDKWIPSNMLFFIAQINIIVDRLREGKRVLVHCNGGKGRTGLVVAAIMIVLGDTAPNAIMKVWKTRKGTLMNPLQLVYLHHFATQYKLYRYNIL